MINLIRKIDQQVNFKEAIAIIMFFFLNLNISQLKTKFEEGKPQNAIALLQHLTNYPTD